MLSAFRWNLRILSYVALVVGAFLIFNTISVSVVRRRPEIGIVRALGASRSVVLGAFLGEAACFGVVGAVVGIRAGQADGDWRSATARRHSRQSLRQQPARAHCAHPRYSAAGFGRSDSAFRWHRRRRLRAKRRWSRRWRPWRAASVSTRPASTRFATCGSPLLLAAAGDRGLLRSGHRGQAVLRLRRRSSSSSPRRRSPFRRWSAA